MITLNIHPAWVITDNHRLHWREKAKRAAALRRLAWLVTREQKLGTLPGKQRCVVTIAWPTRHRRDAINWNPTVKPCIDGMVDAGLLVDDSTKYLVGPDLRVSGERCDPALACKLTFEFQVAA